MTTVRPRPAVAPAASPTALPKPSTAGYWTAAVIALAGLFGAVVGAAFGALGAVTGTSDLARAALPASVAAEVGEPGTLVVYFEGEQLPSLAQLDVRVSGPGGAQVSIDAFAYDLRYDAPAQPGGGGRP